MIFNEAERQTSINSLNCNSCKSYTILQALCNSSGSSRKVGAQARECSRCSCRHEAAARTMPLQRGVGGSSQHAVASNALSRQHPIFCIRMRLPIEIESSRDHAGDVIRELAFVLLILSFYVALYFVHIEHIGRIHRILSSAFAWCSTTCCRLFSCTALPMHGCENNKDWQRSWLRADSMDARVDTLCRKPLWMWHGNSQHRCFTFVAIGMALLWLRPLKFSLLLGCSAS